MLNTIDIMGLFNSLTELLLAAGALVGAIATIVAALGYKVRGTQLKEASGKIIEAQKELVELNDTVRSIVQGVEEFGKTSQPESAKKVKIIIKKMSEDQGTADLVAKSVKEYT